MSSTMHAKRRESVLTIVSPQQFMQKVLANRMGKPLAARMSVGSCNTKRSVAEKLQLTMRLSVLPASGPPSLTSRGSKSSQPKSWKHTTMIKKRKMLALQPKRIFLTVGQ